MNYMHSIKMIHRDLKPENMLLMSKKELTIKITDFGFAKYHEKDDMLIIGSPFYRSPEMYENKLHNEKTDIWSAGVITYELLSGEVPYGGDTVQEV